MNIIGITGINTYVSMLSKQNQAQQRMSGGVKTLPLNAKQWQKSQTDDYISTWAKKNNETQKAARLESITSKLKMGRKLSSADLEYLRANAPAMYEKALKVQKEREEYRKQLERCETKDEVRMVHTRKIAQLMAEMKSASKSGDPEMAWIAMRASMIMDEFVDFVKSERYDEIPNEYEKVQEENEEAKEEDENTAAQDEKVENGENGDSSDSDKKADKTDDDRHKDVSSDSGKKADKTNNDRHKDVSSDNGKKADKTDNRRYKDVSHKIPRSTRSNAAQSIEIYTAPKTSTSANQNSISA